MKITLKINNKIYTAEGEIVFEALTEAVKPLAYPISKEIFKTNGIISTEDGAKKTEIKVSLVTLKRIINNKIAREIWSKRLGILLK
jgi:hypothetical protein